MWLRKRRLARLALRSAEEEAKDTELKRKRTLTRKRYKKRISAYR